MRALAMIMPFALSVAACGATDADRRMLTAADAMQAAVDQTRVCMVAVARKPAYGDLAPHLRLAPGRLTLDQQMDEALPTYQQISELKAWHAEYFDCVDGLLARSQHDFPFMYGAIDQSFSGDDVVYVALAQQKMSWKDANAQLKRLGDASQQLIEQAGHEWETAMAQQSRSEHAERAANWRAVAQGVAVVADAAARTYVATRPGTTTCSDSFGGFSCTSR